MILLEENVTILNEKGLHARTSAKVSQVASQFKCQIKISNLGTSTAADAKNIMQLLMLSATKGTNLKITCQGSDAPIACEAIVTLFKTGFTQLC